MAYFGFRRFLRTQTKLDFMGRELLLSPCGHNPVLVSFDSQIDVI